MDRSNNTPYPFRPLNTSLGDRTISVGLLNRSLESGWNEAKEIFNYRHSMALVGGIIRGRRLGRDQVMDDDV